MIRESRLGRKIRRAAQAETRQADLLIVLRGRFGDDVAAELAPAINAVDDLALLERLLRLASTGGTDEIRSALAARQ